MREYQVTKYFQKEEYLKKYLPTYNYRQGQVDMSQMLEKALNESLTVAIEAPTGYGKTFAYLIAALVCKRRIIISTKTKQLMNQLVEKDIPLILNMMKSDKKVASLKGRSNYFCEFMYYKEVASSILYPDIIAWYNEAKNNGENIIEVPYELFGEDCNKITATHYQCRGRNCKYYNSCAFYSMRKIANEADIVITNHYMLLSDIAIKNDSSEGGIFEECDAVIFDEAHSLLDIFPDLSGANLPLHFVLVFFNEYKLLIDKLNNSNIQARFTDMHSKLWANYNNIAFAMKKDNTLKLANLSVVIDKFMQQAIELDIFLRDNFDNIIGTIASNKEDAERTLFLDEHKKEGFDDELLKYFSNYEKISSYSEEEAICIVERSESISSMVPISVKAIMFDVSSLFKKGIDSLTKSTIYLSATLASNVGGFSFFLSGLGISEECEAYSLPPIFNFEEQARLYVPNINDFSCGGRELADKKRDDFYKYFLARVSGSCLIICNSIYRMQWLYSELSSIGIAKKIYLQNNTNLGKLSFENGDIILIGTASVREGLDIANGSFKTVILDRLPFESHKGLIVEAKQEYIKKHGGNVFNDMTLPRAILFFKQAIGRLIRHEDDFGLWIILDNRILDKNYGKNFLNVLNNTRIVKRLDDAISFIGRS